MTFSNFVDHVVHVVHEVHHVVHVVHVHVIHVVHEYSCRGFDRQTYIHTYILTFGLLELLSQPNFFKKVPSIRQVYGEYNIEDEYLNNMLY